MKLSLKALALAALTILLTGNSTQAAGRGPTCSNKPASAAKSQVNLVLDSRAHRAMLVVVVNDEDGNQVCKTRVIVSTSRNTNGGGWPPKVDRIKLIANYGGAKLIELSTKQAAGTTLYITADKTVKLGNPDGIPFSYN